MIKYKAKYEDNFGFFDINDEEEMMFFCHLYANSLKKTCIRCQRPVRLLPERWICARCEQAMEFGGEK